MTIYPVTKKREFIVPVTKNAHDDGSGNVSALQLITNHKASTRTRWHFAFGAILSHIATTPVQRLHN